MMRYTVLLAFVAAVAGCSSSGLSALPSAPTPVLQPSPSPTPQPTATQWAVFTDPATGFSTSDVHDVQDEVIRVTTADELIWMADGTRFPEFIAAGNFIAYHHAADEFFQIRFGTASGERRAYVTRPDEGLRGAGPTILDVWVDPRGDLKVADTNVPVPAT